MNQKQRSLGDVLQEFSQHRQVMQQELQRVIVGQHDVIEQLFAAIFTRGHCLLEGVPGLAKTLMVSTLARILDVGFKRIQFTPDLMPSDITGTNVLDEDESGRREFRFVEGPIFTNVLLADEINRTPPKTQAALLQAMQERQITAGRTTYDLPDPFFTIATQNPIEQEGTYPLPEAQLDRFMFKVKVNPPTADTLEEILRRTTSGETAEVPKVVDAETVRSMLATTPTDPIAAHLIRYVSLIVEATHPDGATAPAAVKRYVRWGASPRGGQAMVLGAKAAALLEGRPHVTAGDIRWAARSALRHRLVLGYEASAEGVRSGPIIDEVLKSVPEPKTDIRGVP